MKQIQHIYDRQKLIEFFNKGNRVKYIFFWSHRSKEHVSVGKECLSQWFPAPFAIEGVKYYTAEQYMMAEKARLFNDMETFERIIHTKDPAEVKYLGRTVKHFSDNIWKEKCFDIVVSGNMAKFFQNEDLREFLLNTSNRVLVEASPKDKIWGIGLSEDDSRAKNPNLWKGLNLLGFALMKVRDQLKGRV